MILVTGASGNAGGAVVQELLKRGVPLHGMYRNDEDAKKAPPGLIPVVADFASRESLSRALKGVHTVYLVCAPVPELVELESNMIDVCRQNDVGHVILNSALGAADYPKSFPGWHRKVEDKLKASGLGFTILRPNSFMQNILWFFAPSIREQGAFYLSMGDARTSFVDLRDIAAVVAGIAISPDDHFHKTYELNGPEALTHAELAQRIARVCGQPVSFVDIPEPAQRKAMLEMGMPIWRVDALLDLQRYYTQGQGGDVTEVLPKLLNRPATRMDAFLKEFKDSFRRSNEDQHAR